MGRIWILLAACLILLGASRGEAASSDAIKRNNFGGELIKQGKLDEALAEFQQAVTLDPSFAAAQVNLAYTYDRLGRADEAIAQYRKALELEPGNVFGHNNLGVLLDKKGLYDEAIGIFERALKIDPSNATVQGNLANARKNKAIIQEREARIAGARKQVEANPKDPRAAYNLARVYAALDMKDQAFEWLGKALQLGFDDIRFVREDPALAGIKTDPRFGKLLEGR